MKVYFNPVQLRCQYIAANTSVMVCGRRTGKTDGMAAPFLLRCVQRMPGSTGGIVVPTFLHGLTNTIPGVLAAIRRWGYIEGVHFVIGRQPPDYFAKPIIKPASYQHVISFYNGSVAVLLSQDRAYAANSLTLSWLLIDEAKFIDFKKLKDQTLPANGGNKFFFGSSSANHAMMILSDMPQTKKGSWFLNYREKSDPRVIEAIEGQVYEIWRLNNKKARMIAQGKTPPAYIDTYIRRLDRDLNRLRSVAVYYRECSSIENIELIGEKYIRQMKRDLTPLTFRTSIMCERLGVAHDGFYSNLTDAHLYDASSFAFLDTLWQSDIVSPSNPSNPSDYPLRDSSDYPDNSDSYNSDYHPSRISPAVSVSSADADVDPDAPICIGMDYNANINWIVAGQPQGRRLNVIKSFYVKFERKLNELVDDFCAYYSSHRRKEIIFYYDSTALGQGFYISDGKDVRTIVISRFQRWQWSVIDVYIGAPMRHDEKYRLINLGFTGHNNLTPCINRQNNNDLVLAMQCAGVERGRLGFRKDKAGEKVPETEENLLEHRTDGTDAFDTLYIGCERFPKSPGSSFFVPTSII